MDLYRDNADSDEQRSRLGSVLHQLRLNNELRVETVAMRADISQSYVRMIERGERQPSPQKLLAFLGAVGFIPAAANTGTGPQGGPDELGKYRHHYDPARGQVRACLDSDGTQLVVTYRRPRLPDEAFTVPALAGYGRDYDDLPPAMKNDVMLAQLMCALVSDSQLVARLYDENIATHGP